MAHLFPCLLYLLGQGRELVAHLVQAMSEPKSVLRYRLMSLESILPSNYKGSIDRSEGWLVEGV